MRRCPDNSSVKAEGGMGNYNSQRNLGWRMRMSGASILVRMRGLLCLGHANEATRLRMLSCALRGVAVLVLEIASDSHSGSKPRAAHGLQQNLFPSPIYVVGTYVDHDNWILPLPLQVPLQPRRDVFNLGSSNLKDVPWTMGQTVCICSRGTITIDNKRYFFIQKLDEGGFSYVDLVESVQNGHFYALKRIICHDKEDCKNALNEVEMHRMFNHPNILHLEAHCIMDKGPKCEGWLLLPYIKNGSLWAELEKLRDANSFMSEERILNIFHGLCRGLKAIHDQGYAHRDLKPTNVLLDDNEQPVLMDLGSMNKARIEVKGSREAMTIQDWAAQRCTISYRAPELFSVASHCIIDERTDIWSLGCVLYAMMFLEGPYDSIFHRGDCVALAVQNAITIPENCRYTQSLQHLLTSTMVTNPQERPNITWVLNQTKQLLPVGAVQETNMI